MCHPSYLPLCRCHCAPDRPQSTHRIEESRQAHTAHLCSSSFDFLTSGCRQGCGLTPSQTEFITIIIHHSLWELSHLHNHRTRSSEDKHIPELGSSFIQLRPRLTPFHSFNFWFGIPYRAQTHTRAHIQRTNVHVHQRVSASRLSWQRRAPLLVRCRCQGAKAKETSLKGPG